MNLQFMQLELIWPAGLPANQLRSWLLDQLAQHGEPLRWALIEVESFAGEQPSASEETSADRSAADKSAADKSVAEKRTLKLEAVMIRTESGRAGD
ncbi:MAG: hypothetical protein QGH53_00805 [Prochlorococcaceae cyanobacterium ETNP18_MAG_1]|nr:hypothetical protein [Prochlorococcaceae cyanobacterium ETNP18_MAG_1]